MSEYIEIETEISDDNNTMYFYTNLTLTEEGPEQYDSVQAMEEGSPVAQALARVPGVKFLRVEESDLVVTRDPDVSWHGIVADVSAVLKDFFL